MDLRAASLWTKCVVAGALAVGVTAAPGAGAAAPIVHVPLVVGVDHVDQVNQDPANGRLFEYTDFFSRDITVREGAVVDFQTAPGAFHIIALAKSEKAARSAYPVATAENGDAKTLLGVPKVAFGPSNFPIVNGNTDGDLSKVDFSKPNGPPDCGAALGQADCTFSGGHDIEVAGPNLNFDNQGNPLPADWRVKITADEGTYTFFCYIHPGMRGTLHVVDSDDPSTTQSTVDEQSQEQFTHDRSQALAAEKAANVVSFSGGKPGHRTYSVQVGVAAADNHVAIDEMLPNPATVTGGPPTLRTGDRVRYLWRDPHNVHSVFFPANVPDIGPFGFDCPSGYVPADNGPPPPLCNEGSEGVELIADPGNAASGTALVNPTTTLDSGVLLGRAYGVRPSAQQWSVRVGKSSAPGIYTFHCTVHDFMLGSFTVAP